MSIQQYFYIYEVLHAYVSLLVYKLSIGSKAKGARGKIWRVSEKKLFLECINNHLSIVESKGNENSMIEISRNLMGENES